jgi:hypothetical protein
MNTNTRTCHPGDSSKALNRLPQLAEPLLQFDLVNELRQLRGEASWQRGTGRSSKTLFGARFRHRGYAPTKRMISRLECVMHLSNV